MTDTRRRVKLYALNAERQWDDRGTGHVSSCYIEKLKGTSLLVKAELDSSVLLESRIQPDTAYQKQQDTLIVWSEGDSYDLALSFQEKAGCDEIWEKICQVQGKDPSVEITQDIVEESEDEKFEEMSDMTVPIDLPAVELSRLEEIKRVLTTCLASPQKEKLSMALESENYIKKLLNLFHMCEDLDNLEGLHHLYEIFRFIFLLNQNTLFETMFSEDYIFDVVGCLEYDPSSAQPKKHRLYLRELATFKEVIPIKNPELLAKIHQTYRVQYIQDVIFHTPSVFEENMSGALSTFIFFNKVEIVKIIEDDKRFLTDLFKLLTDEKTSNVKRRDLVLFLKELCSYSQNLQLQEKDTFYKILVSLGILPALEITLGVDDQKTKTASIDILTFIVEFSPSVVRDYTLQQENQDEEQLLLNIIIEQMLRDHDPELGGAVQLMGVLRMLLDPENMLTAPNKSEKTDFLNFFYRHGLQTLITPLLTYTSEEAPMNEEYHTVQLLGLVLDLMSFCVEHHTYHIKNCVINKDLLRKVLFLMKSTHTFLVLGALRVMRKIIALKDEIYNRYIIKGNLFMPVIEALLRNNGRYNLLDSAILELFEFIKTEDIKSLCQYIVEQFGKLLEDIEYVQTFKELIKNYNLHQGRSKDRDKVSSITGVTEGVVPSIMRTPRNRRDPRQLEEEEESWFEDEEAFEGGTPEDDSVVPTPPPTIPSAVSDSELDSIGKLMEKKNELNIVNAVNGPRTLTPNSPPLQSNTTQNSSEEIQLTEPKLFNKGLVDYEGDSDEEEDAPINNTEDIVVANTPVVAVEPSGSPPLTPPPDDAPDSPTQLAKRPRLS